MLASALSAAVDQMPAISRSASYISDTYLSGQTARCAHLTDRKPHPGPAQRCAHVASQQASLKGGVKGRSPSARSAVPRSGRKGACSLAHGGACAAVGSPLMSELRLTISQDFAAAM